MGKKKAFIDKKKAVTYCLVYRDPGEDPEGEDGGHTLAPVGGHRGGAQLGADDYLDYYDEGDSVYESEYSLAMSRSAAAHHDSSYAIGEERRRELLSLGFPDDGYDYLRHLRDLGRGRPPPPGGRAGVAPIPEDQELDGFDEEGGAGGGEWEEGSGNEEDFTIYDQPEPAAGAAVAGPSAAAAQKKLDAAALAAAEAAAAAGPSTSAGAGGRVAASAAAGPGPGSARTAAAAARSAAARSVATTGRTQGSAVGPSVYVPAARLLPPKADVKVVDARRLVVRPKGHDEEAAAAALSDVTALARHTELYGTRGKLYQDLDEVEKSMAAIENGVDASRKEVVEGDEWADWLDDFVAGGGDDEAAAAAASGSAGAAAGRAGGDGEGEEQDDGEGGGSSEEPEEEEEDADEWRMRHRRQQEQGQGGASAGAAAAAAAAPARAGPGVGGGGGEGVGAASVASSMWRRPERRDRREGFEALDAQFERLAVEYDDDEIGALDDGRYGDDDDDDDDEEEGEGEDDDSHGAARRQAGRVGGGGGGGAAAGTCELADYADVLDEFLSEQRATEALEEKGLKQLQATDDVVLQASRPDPEALAVTRARMQRQMEAAEAATAGGAAADDVPVRTLVVQEAERWDCESILSLTSNLENHPAKIVEPQRRTGGRGGGLIRLSAKTGMPVTRGAARGGGGGAAGGTIPEEAEGEEGEEEEGGTCSDSEDPEGEEGGVPGGSVMDPALLSRRKGETAEERKARKAAVKEARRTQRTAKKEMKTMFRQQATRAQKQSAGRSQAAGSTYIIP